MEGPRKHEKVGLEGAPFPRATFGMKRAPKIFFMEMLATGGEGGRERKINAIINQRPLR
jgi:hypothetical protein